MDDPIDKYISRHLLLSKELKKVLDNSIDVHRCYKIEMNNQKEAKIKLYQQLDKINEEDFKIRNNEIQNQLIELYRTFLKEFCSSDLKKDKIILLKSTFPSIWNGHIAKAVNCSFFYVSHFKKRDNEYVYTIERRSNVANVSKAKRNEVLSRDGMACVWCGSKENLIVHHIIPIQYSKKSDSRMKNLAILCETCHKLVHKVHRGYSIYTIYGNSIQKFWDWPRLYSKMEEAFGDIKGVGKRIITNLCANFKNMENIKKGTIDELESVPYVTKRIAYEIKKKLSNN